MKMTLLTLLFQGGTIQLLYFPPGLSHAATGPVIASTLGTEFTSPTNYISFATVFAKDACKNIGTTIASTIVPIPPTDQLSSAWGIPIDCMSIDMFAFSNSLTGTASFNITDILSTPVPFSIVTSQIGCANAIASNACNPNACGTNQPYKPFIVVPDGLLARLEPEWASCSVDLRGLYDPPVKLTPVATVAGPILTAPGMSTAMAATPASGPSASQPSITAGTSNTQLSIAGQTSFSDTTTTTRKQQSADPSTPSTSPSSAGDSAAESQATSPILLTVSDDTALVNSGATSYQQSSVGILLSQSTAEEQGPQAASSSADPAGVIVSVLAESLQRNPKQSETQGQEASAANSGASVNALSILSIAETSAALQPGSPTTFQPANSDIPTSANAGVVVNVQSVSGSQATTINGLAVSVDSNVAVIAGSTIIVPLQGLLTTIDGQAVTVKPLSDPTDSNVDPVADPIPSTVPGSGTAQHPENQIGGFASSFAVDSQFLTVTPGQPLVIEGSTVSPGGPAAIIGGQTMSEDSTALIVDGPNTIPLAPAMTSDLVVITGSNGQSLRVVLQDSSAAVENGGSTTTVALEPSFHLDGGSSSIPSNGRTGVIDGSDLGFSVVSTAATVPLLTEGVVTGMNGQKLTFIQQGSAVLAEDGIGTVTVEPGLGATLDGTTISVPSSGGDPVVNGQRVTMSAETSEDGAYAGQATAVVMGSDGHPVTLAPQASYLVIEDGSSTTTVAPGDMLTLDGEIFSMPNSAVGGLMMDGATISFLSGMTNGGQTEAIVTGSDGQPMTIILKGSNVVVDGIPSTVTVDAGEKLTLDGETIGVPKSSDGVVVVDGTTIYLSNAVIRSTSFPSLQTGSSILPTLSSAGETTTSASETATATTGQAQKLVAPWLVGLLFCFLAPSIGY